MVSALTISQWRNVLIVYACVPVLIVYRVRDDFKYDFRDHNKMGASRVWPRVYVSVCIRNKGLP